MKFSTSAELSMYDFVCVPVPLGIVNFYCIYHVKFLGTYKYSNLNAGCQHTVSSGYGVSENSRDTRCKSWCRITIIQRYASEVVRK